MHGQLLVLFNKSLRSRHVLELHEAIRLLLVLLATTIAATLITLLFALLLRLAAEVFKACQRTVGLYQFLDLLLGHEGLEARDVDKVIVTFIDVTSLFHAFTFLLSRSGTLALLPFNQNLAQFESTLLLQCGLSERVRLRLFLLSFT